MPLTSSGTKVLSNMQSEYGSEKGKRVFYASINKGRLKKSKMEGSRTNTRGRKGR